MIDSAPAQDRVPVHAVVWPPVDHADELGDLLGRLAHYLGTARDLTLFVAVPPDTDLSVPERPAEVDGVAVDPVAWDALAARTRFATRADLPREIDFALLRRTDADRFPGRLAAGTCVVDPADPGCAVELARASSLCRRTDELLAHHRIGDDPLLGDDQPPVARVHALAAPVEVAPDGVVVADAAAVLDGPVPAGLRAVTSTDVRWCAPGPEAAARRAALTEVLRASGARLVCTDRDAGLLLDLEPALAAHLVVVPTGLPRDFPVADLRARPLAAPPFDDLLTLLLPLAAALGDEVVVHGATAGATPDPSLRAALTPRSVRVIEENFVAVRSATDTDLAVLRRRQDPPVTSAAPRAVDLAVLSPDYETDFGHFGVYARATVALAASRGLSALTLAARSLRSDDPDVVQFFTAPTLPLRAYPVHASTWRAEVAAALGEWVAPGGVAFMDCAGFQHVDAAADVAGAYPDRRLVLNLMDGHDTVADARSRGAEAHAAAITVRAVLAKAAAAGVVVTVDSEALAEDVREVTGQLLPVLPMSSAFEPDGVAAGPRADDPPLVLFPGKLRGGKGLDVLESLVLPLLTGPEPMRVALRPDAATAGVSRRVLDILGRIEEAGGELLDSRVDADDFYAVLRSASVVALPYDPAEFRTRTSGLVVDSLLAETPVVTSAGTWGALVVEREGGTSGDYRDPAQFVDAIRATVADADRLRSRLADSAPRLRAEFALERRLDFLLEVQPLAVVEAPPVDHGSVLSVLHTPSAARAGVGPGVRVTELSRELDDARRANEEAARRITAEADARRVADDKAREAVAERRKAREARDRFRDERDVLRSELKDAKAELVRARRPWWGRAAAWLERLFEGG